MVERLRRLYRDQEGATAVEYGLILAAVAGVIITVLFVVGNKVNNRFTTVNNKMP